MNEAILIIYFLGICLFGILSIIKEDWAYLIVAPIWPLIYIKICIDYLRHWE